MPTRWGKITPNDFFTICTEHAVSQHHKYKTQQYLKNQQEKRPLASPHRSVGGHTQAEIQSHPLGGGDSGEVGRGAHTNSSVDEREVTARTLPEEAAGGRGGGGGCSGAC